MAQVPGPRPEDAAAILLRARAMREDAHRARERNRGFLRANEEMRERLRQRRAARADSEPDTDLR
jgi:hypothetical protein